MAIVPNLFLFELFPEAIGCFALTDKMAKSQTGKRKINLVKETTPRSKYDHLFKKLTKSLKKARKQL